MKKIYLWIILPTILCACTLIFYFSVFNHKLSTLNSDWGTFGDYLAGTIGIIISFITLILIYLTFREQRKMAFEDTFQQLVSNYNNLISLIHERWLHIDTDSNGNPIYLKGREIFGRSVEYLGQSNQIDKFKEIYAKHINVFYHYFNDIQEVLTTIRSYNELKMSERNSYYSRFSSNLSYFELVMIAYFMEVFITDSNTRLILKEHFIKRLNEIDLTDEIPHKVQVKYIMDQINH